MTDYQRIIRWELNEDGGGTALLFEHAGETVKETRLVFDAIGQIPPGLAAAIRKDGGRVGEVKLPIEVPSPQFP